MVHSHFFRLCFSVAIRRVLVNQDGLKLNGTHQHLFYADEVNILDGRVQIIQNSIKTLFLANNAIGLEAKAD